MHIWSARSRALTRVIRAGHFRLPACGLSPRCPLCVSLEWAVLCTRCASEPETTQELEFKVLGGGSDSGGGLPNGLCHYA